MFYKHWKKLALAFSGLLWAGCSGDDSGSSSGAFSPCYGVEVPTNVLCYNDTAVNDSGTVFDIINCIDGERYLRFQGLYQDLPELQKELPADVHPVPPRPSDSYASNCVLGPDTCIDGAKEDENGNLTPVGGCYPTIECPEINDAL